MKHEDYIESKGQWYPSNGTEGMSFIDTWCSKCIKDPSSRNPDAITQCSILSGSLMGKHPKQWIINNQGRAICTSFRDYTIKKMVYRKMKIKNQIRLFE